MLKDCEHCIEFKKVLQSLSKKLYDNEKPVIFLYMHVDNESQILKEITVNFFPHTIIINNGQVNPGLDQSAIQVEERFQAIIMQMILLNKAFSGISQLARKMQKGTGPKPKMKMSFKSNFFSSQLKSVLS
jgi:hypothetical protein